MSLLTDLLQSLNTIKLIFLLFQFIASCIEIENTPADETLVSELATSVQEVDVVVLPSLLQSDVSKKAVKKTKKVHKQETGNKQGQFDEKLQP